MPPGMAVVRDGTDVGGVQPPTHATIYATEPMTPETFIERLGSAVPIREEEMREGSAARIGDI